MQSERRNSNLRNRMMMLTDALQCYNWARDCRFAFNINKSLWVWMRGVNSITIIALHGTAALALSENGLSFSPKREENLQWLPNVFMNTRQGCTIALPKIPRGRSFPALQWFMNELLLNVGMPEHRTELAKHFDWETSRGIFIEEFLEEFLL